MIKRLVVLFLAGVLVSACAHPQQHVAHAKKKQEYLHIYPDGRMELNGRTLNEEDVIIYNDGRGGERAAVKLIIPRRPDVYRDSIIVDRKEVDVLVVRRI